MDAGRAVRHFAKERSLGRLVRPAVAHPAQLVAELVGNQHLRRQTVLELRRLECVPVPFGSADAADPQQERSESC